MLKRSGFALFIGYFNSILFGIGLISSVVVLVCKELIDSVVKNEHVNKDLRMQIFDARVSFRHATLLVVVFCLIMASSSCLFVTGVIKRRHKFMRPWLFLNFIGIFVSFFATFYFAITASVHGTSLAMGGLTCSIIQCLIFHPIYKLYQGIRNQGIKTADLEKPVV